MRRRLPFCSGFATTVALAGGLLLCPLARAGEWFELGGFGADSTTDAPSDTLLEADLNALRAHGSQRSLVLRLSFRPPRQAHGLTFRSVQATLSLSCDSGKASWKDARFFSDEKGQGQLLHQQRYDTASGPGLALEKTDWLPWGGWALLRKSACTPINTVETVESDRSRKP